MSAAAAYLECELPRPEVLVREHAGLVKRIALHLAHRLPDSVELDDLMQAGMIGLLEAAQNFRADAGASFETFAGFRIRGAMIDELRRGDWAPRSVHRGMREAAETLRSLEQRLGRPASDAEVAAELNMDESAYQRLMADASRCQVLPLEITDDEGEHQRMEMPAASEDVAGEFEEQAFRSALVGAIKSLPERDQMVLSLYYEQGLNLKEIGAVLGVSESRVCQLQGRASLRLRGAMQDWMEHPQAA